MWKPLRCVIRYKDTNLKAIHNTYLLNYIIKLAVSSDTKIQIWKQFTTAVDWYDVTVGLCHPIQRYKFESNSQRPVAIPWLSTSCVIRYKDTNLKAIHNSPSTRKKCGSAVSSDTKIQIWKQFTTAPAMRLHCLSCVIPYKDTNLKAIHNWDLHIAK